MALLDRVKVRTGSDLPDGELQAMIDAIMAEIAARLGSTGEVTVELGDPGDPCSSPLRSLRLPRPLDEAQAVSITEITPGNSGDEEGETALTHSDFRVLHGGRTLQRLTSGPNGAAYWAPMVRISYTPIGVTGAIDEAVIKIMQLDLSYRGLIKSERAGDYQWQAANSPEGYTAEREAILASLQAPRGMVLA